MNMDVIVNIYQVQMYEYGNLELRKSRKLFASSEEEAIKKTINESFWYDEGHGRDSKKINYPITFRAILRNDL